jgi:hypothetical protein
MPSPDRVDGPTKSARPDPIEAGATLFAEIAQLPAELGTYVVGQFAMARIALRKLVIRVLAAFLGLFVVVGLLFAAAWQLVLGIAGAFALLTPDFPWLGPLLAGVSVLLILGLGFVFLRRKVIVAAQERALDRLKRRRERSPKKTSAPDPALPNATHS